MDRFLGFHGGEHASRHRLLSTYPTMHFKDIKLPRRPSPDGDARPSTPGDGSTNGRRGRPLQKGESGVSAQGAAVDPELAGRQPKRSSSFGLGLGGLQSLANGMSKAGESLTRKTTGASSDGTKTPPIAAHTSITPSTIPMGPPTLPDSSHLAQFSLKLSELVNRSFMPCTGLTSTATSGSTGGLAGAAKNAAAMTSVHSHQGTPSLGSIAYEGKKLPSKPIVMEIAKTVVAELEYACSVDPYLLRAVSRSALKALTLFANRIDSLLVPVSKDPTVTFVPSTAKEGLHIPAGLEFNLGLVTLEWIVEDALERCIEGLPGTTDEGMPYFVSEILTPVRKKMEGTILHVIQPVISNVKASLTLCLSKAVPLPFSGFGHALSPVSSATTPLLESAPSTPSGLISPTSGNGTPSPSHAWLRELEGRLEGVRRLLVPRIEERCGQDGEGWFISVAIHLIWKGLLILTTRTLPMPQTVRSPTAVPAATTLLASEANKRSPSPAQLTSALKSVSVKPRKVSGTETPSGHATPSLAVAGTVSSMARATAQQVQELQAFEKLVIKFSAGFAPSHPKNLSVCKTDGNGEDSSDDDDDDDDDEDELARAALAEALQAIKSTILLVQYLDTQADAILDVALPHKDRSHSSGLPVEVVRAAKATPPLLLLHLIYARMPTHLPTFASVIKEGGLRTEPVVPSPPGIFGYTWSDYERAIAGFAGGQSWAYALVEAWREDLEEADAALDARKMKLSQETEEKHLLTVNSDALDPAESTPTPASVLLRRAASTRSATDSSESLPEEMTASAPTLDREKALVEAAAATMAASNPAKPSAWNSLTRSRKGASSRASETRESGGSPSPPDNSPPLSPDPGPGSASTSKVVEGGKARRFWRANSSQGNPNGGFHLPGRSNLRAASPPTMSPTFTEEERSREDMRLEREGVRLLKRAIGVVEAARKPALV